MKNRGKDYVTPVAPLRAIRTCLVNLWYVDAFFIRGVVPFVMKIVRASFGFDKWVIDFLVNVGRVGDRADLEDLGIGRPARRRRGRAWDGRRGDGRRPARPEDGDRADPGLREVHGPGTDRAAAPGQAVSLGRRWNTRNRRRPDRSCS